MALKEVSFRSYNERDMIKGWIYIPTIQNPKGIVQIVHGLGEHSRRYMHFILTLNEAGYVVCADDHIGHGKTALDGNTWGDFGNKGYLTASEDEYNLYKITREMYPDLPYIMFGHSWGSIIVRNYAEKYGDTLNGLIICGAPAGNSSFLNMRDKIKPYIDSGKDNEVVEEFLIEGFGTWTNRYDNVKSPNDWIAADEDVVIDHGKDPLNFFGAFNVRVLYDVSESLWNIQGKEWAEKLPEDLPIYNIAGDMDPAADFGEGTYKITRWLYEAGRRNVKTKVYSDYRHEILNEPPIRDEVEKGIVDFINNCIE